jgi:hypothetical protein
MFPHRNIREYTLTSPGGKTDKQAGHILTGDGIQLSILEVLSFIEADYDIDHYLVVAVVRGRV